MEMIKRQLRAAQSHFPFVRAAKFELYNWGTRRFGLNMVPEIAMLERLGPVGLALDIGGNWGQSIWALKRGPAARRIVSFEPNRLLSRRLERRFAGDPSVQIMTMALGDASGAFTLYTPRYRDFVYDGLASLLREQAEGWLNAERVAHFDPALLTIEEQAVEVRTLDSFGFAPDVVKIDVQGAENMVVRGGLETFRAHRPATVVETPDPALISQFRELGLQPWRAQDGRLVPAPNGAADVLFLDEARHARIAGGA